MEYTLVLLIVFAAGGYLVRQSWRVWMGGKAGCGGGCKCGPKSAPAGQRTLISPDQLTLRRR